MTNTLMDRLCSLAAVSAREDPVGTAGTYSRIMAFEAPTPWGSTFYHANPEGTMPQRVAALRIGFFYQLRAQGIFTAAIENGYPSLYAIAPDPEWSRPGERRVLLALPPEGLSRQYEMHEYFFPFDSNELLDFVDAFLRHPEQLCAFAKYEHERPPYREFFVCTHGQVDICCAKFGVPLYRQAREAYPRVRAWRVSHFGGHRFAPTAMEYPMGYKWGFLDEAATSRLIDQTSDYDLIAETMRGYCAFPAKVQVLDRQGFLDYGWDWLDMPRTGSVVHIDEDNKRWTVALRAETPNGLQVYEGVVTVNRVFDNPGCGAKWGTHPVSVEELRLESFARR